MVIFLYNLYIFIWTHHFWGSPLNKRKNIDNIEKLTKNGHFSI